MGVTKKQLETEILNEAARELERDMLRTSVGTTIGPFPPGQINRLSVDWAAKVQADQDHVAFLNETQNMRVVSLNEACVLAKALIEKGVTMNAQDIVHTAQAFNRFLVHGKVA